MAGASSSNSSSSEERSAGEEPSASPAAPARRRSPRAASSSPPRLASPPRTSARPPRDHSTHAHAPRCAICLDAEPEAGCATRALGPAPFWRDPLRPPRVPAAGAEPACPICSRAVTVAVRIYL
eukprot:tig00021621_g22967.t1